MYPRPFEYARPESVAEALEALAGDGASEARPLAGGQSLVPMMSLGLAAPDLLVDLARLPLAGSEGNGGGTVRLGALTRHRELERSAELAARVPLASEAARFIGNPRVRNRGTLGGSLSHADPASELGTVALAYGGRAVITGQGGERSVDFDEFFHGFFETAVESGELLTAVELDVPGAGSGHGFHEVAGRADDFAIAAAAAVVTLDEAGAACADARLALAGIADRPLRIGAGEDVCRGAAIDEPLLDRVAAAVTEAVTPEDDAFVSAEYRARAAGTCAARALAAAWERAREGAR
ncbi:MAG TPA: xanthine dehydrogenase family protein subunit M [Solirubrobacterales bacterium]|nr:xanthine dehydrogenase family protein subunit M [Solirubrobacterales bacterium]